MDSLVDGLILDSTAAVNAERQGGNAARLAINLQSRFSDLPVGLSVITALELAHGVARADKPERRGQRQVFLHELATTFTLVPVSLAIAIQAGRIAGELKASGVQLGLADLLIASTALHLRCALVTENVRHFRRFPGLEVLSL